MKRILGLVLVAALAVMSLTACMGDDDNSSARQQRRTAALGPSGGAGQEYQLTIESVAPAPQVTATGEAINVESFSWDATNPTTIGSATGGASTSKIKFNEFVIKKTVDKTSPKFFQTMAVGAHYKKATLSVRKAGAKEPYYEIRFSTVFVSNIANAGDNPNVPMESITLVYGAMETVARGLQELGDPEGPPVQYGWDQVTNKHYVSG